MDPLFDLPNETHVDDLSTFNSLSAFDSTFPTRVAVLMRSRPITEAIGAASRQDWPAGLYDIATLSLAAIDLVISRQGFDEEATFDDLVAGLVTLAQRAAHNRPSAEHRRVAEFAVNALLNRGEREAPFTYRISDFTDTDAGHLQRQVQFRLLVEREDAARCDVVINATRDAINALVGGLEFDVEDEQVANEILLERQLAKGAFDAAERAAVRARLLSVSLADDLTRLIKTTRRDLRTVMDEWANLVPTRLEAAREHIRGRLDAEHRLLTKVRESMTSDDASVAATTARIAVLLQECSRRHEALHGHVITARGVFLVEQDRQAFRPPALGHLPDLGFEVLAPLLRLDSQTALTLTDRWLSDVTGPRPPHLPRLYRLVYDLWASRGLLDGPDPDDDGDDIGEPDPPTIPPEVVDAARRVVGRVGLPARLSALLADAVTAPDLSAADRQQTAEILALAVLWCYAPEEVDSDQPMSTDLAAQILGARAAADADGRELRLRGWAGDDLIIAAHPDGLAFADPTPVELEPVSVGDA